MDRIESNPEFQDITNLLKVQLGIENNTISSHALETGTSLSPKDIGSKNIQPGHQGLLDVKQMDTLKKIMECPVCLQTPGTCTPWHTMYLCTLGHSICSNCSKKIQECPLCKKPLLKTRNLLVEEILSAIDVKCIYATEGCTQELIGDKKSHTSKCWFRPISCNFSGDRHTCKNSAIKYTNYIKHLIAVHHMEGRKGTDLKITQYLSKPALSLTNDIPWHDWPIQYMEAFDENEIFITGSAINAGNLFWWLYVFGDNQVSAKYSVQIILSGKRPGLLMSWTGPVHSIRLQPDTIKKRGLCLMVCKESLHPFTYTGNTVANTTGLGNDNEVIGLNLAFSVFKRHTQPQPTMTAQK